MKIRECMKRKVISIGAGESLGQAARLLVEHHIGTLPVVDEQNRLVGLLHLRNLLALVTPDFVRLVGDFNFVHDFGAVEDRLPSLEQINMPVAKLMQTPIFVDEDSGLLRAFSVLDRHALSDLPILDKEGKLIGIASRVDIGVALLKGWLHSGGGAGA